MYNRRQVGSGPTLSESGRPWVGSGPALSESGRPWVGSGPALLESGRPWVGSRPASVGKQPTPVVSEPARVGKRTARIVNRPASVGKCAVPVVNGLAWVGTGITLRWLPTDFGWKANNLDWERTGFGRKTISPRDAESVPGIANCLQGPQGLTRNGLWRLIRGSLDQMSQAGGPG